MPDGMAASSPSASASPGSASASPAPAQPTDAGDEGTATIWAFGRTIHTSADGGRHWRPQQSPVREGLSAAAFADRSYGWLVGGDVFGCTDVAPERGVVLATSDGGRHWRTQLVSSSLGFCGVTCVDRTHAWVVAEALGGCRVMATSDGGRTWVRQARWHLGGQPHIVFADRRHGWACTLLAVLATTDGGRHWQRQLGDENALQEFHDIDFCDADHGFVVGQHALLSTSDGGATWRELAGPDGDHVAVSDPDHVVIAQSGGTMFWTSDGGQQWQESEIAWPRPKAPLRLLWDVAFATPALGWALCSWGDQRPQDAILVTRDGGAHWQVQRSVSRWGTAGLACAP
jgi:photosystem II stability/assembly factor-like uncharacterized protein